MLRTPRSLVPLVLLVVLLAGCSKERACSLVGADSGVSFSIDPVLGGVKGTVRVHACVEDSCITEKFGTHNASPRVFVPYPSATSAGTVDAVLTIEDSSGHTVFDGTATALLHINQPNGPDCPPTAYQASVTATESGTLEQSLSS